MDGVGPVACGELGPLGGPDDVVRRRDEAVQVQGRVVAQPCEGLEAGHGPCVSRGELRVCYSRSRRRKLLAMTRVPRSQRPMTNPERYKWNALSNTTLGSFMALFNQSIVIISLPAIFRGIHLQPLAPGNFGYLLWLLLGYLVVTAVLVVALGRIGDQFGRVKMYNAGFLVFTVASIGLAFSPVTGPSGALVLIALRLVQGVGGAMLMANSTAILTDAFPVSQRGTALGFNIIAGTFASFLGLLVGGALAGIDWRLVFLVSVPFGLFGTVWAYATLRETGTRAPARLDIWGNLTFAVGLVLIMIGLTYGLQPYGSHTMGWTSPVVLSELIGGVVLLALFVWIEKRVPEPMFHLSLFKIRAFAGAGTANLLANMGRGGLQFMLILWLQGIWLPLHGYSFERTPLWSGIYMVPMSIGFLVAGPLSGRLSDRYGQRGFSTAGMVVAAASFIALMQLPINFVLRLVRVPVVRERDRSRAVRCAEHDDDHERGSRGPARGGIGDASDIHELGVRAFDRDLLLPDGRRARLQAAVDPLAGSRRPGGVAVGRPSRGEPPAGRDPVRRIPRLQPDAVRCSVRTFSRASVPKHAASPHGEDVLPEPHLGTVPLRSGHRLLGLGGTVRPRPRSPAGGPGTVAVTETVTSEPGIGATEQEEAGVRLAKLGS